MKELINCFLPYGEAGDLKRTIKGLKKSGRVKNIYLLSNEDKPAIEDCEVLHCNGFRETATLRAMASLCDAPYTMIYTKTTVLDWGYLALDRWLQITEDVQPAMSYADHFDVADGKRSKVPVIDYQKGSLRDDFDFGPVLMYRTASFIEAVARMKTDYQFGALYDLRLKASEEGELMHINEYLYYEVETDTRKSGEKLFDYVDPKNRATQVEMEQICTEHLKTIGGYLAPGNQKELDFSTLTDDFEYEASVVIPVKNRAKTIRDCILSAWKQETSFKYNVLVVDDNSTDGTSEIIDELALQSDRVFHICQDTTFHGIGGNWNVALHDPRCGRFALQLDSDDMYYDAHTVEKFVKAFYEQQCAMVIGTYQMTDFDLNPIPPGVIDHKEWTPENGRNNALRINGLGAPRGFYVPFLREINFPTTKYGEDYEVGLRVSREYKIGRIYDVIYNCRRWGENSDASLDVEQTNRNNIYKDRLRTWELQARIALNRKKLQEGQSL